MYYVFDVKEDICSLYRDKPSSLFKILNSIYYMHCEEKEYGFNILRQLTNKIDIDKLNQKLYIYFHGDLVYSKNDNEHVINNLYADEISVLKVHKSHLLIQSNCNYSSFFKILGDYNGNYFVCDFLEKDFFFLKDINNYVDI